MNDFRTPYAPPSQLGVRPATQLSAAFLTQAFFWMFAGLMLTTGVTVVVQLDDRLAAFARGAFLPLILAELAVVLVISAAIRRVGAVTALGLFFAYAAMNGVTIGLIVRGYTGASAATAFFSAASMFGVAALYGAITKRSLASLGGYLAMGVVGLIVALVVNGLLLHSGPGSLIISIFGVVIFTGLTAYDTQRIAAGDLAARLGSMEKAAVFGALQLYLDFINLFLMFLRLFGSRR